MFSRLCTFFVFRISFGFRKRFTTILSSSACTLPGSSPFWSIDFGCLLNGHTVGMPSEMILPFTLIVYLQIDYGSLIGKRWTVFASFTNLKFKGEHQNNVLASSSRVRTPIIYWVSGLDGTPHVHILWSKGQGARRSRRAATARMRRCADLRSAGRPR